MYSGYLMIKSACNMHMSIVLLVSVYTFRACTKLIVQVLKSGH